MPDNNFEEGLDKYQIEFVNENVTPLIKMHYPNYRELPGEYLFKTVPEVYSSKKYDAYATYFECLITNDLL